MLVPIMPTVALLGFAGFAVNYGIRKQWQNAVICLLCGLLAFSFISQFTKKPKGDSKDKERITTLENRVRVLEENIQKLQATDVKK
jgi:uncharacterized membrane protein YfcA